MAEQNTFADLVGQTWKAIVAGAGAGIGASWALLAPIGGAHGILADGKIDANEWGSLIGTFFIVGVPVGVATWAKRNKPAKQEKPQEDLPVPEVSAADYNPAEDAVVDYEDFPADPTPSRAAVREAQGPHN